MRDTVQQPERFSEKWCLRKDGERFVKVVLPVSDYRIMAPGGVSTEGRTRTGIREFTWAEG